MGMTAEEKLVFEQRCRTCLLRQGQHNIFESTNYIRIELLYLTNLEIRKCDKLPVSICDHCLNDLRSACAFKKKCQESYFSLIEEYESYSYKSDNPVINTINIKPDIESEPLSSPQIKSENDQRSYSSDDENDLRALLEPQIIVQEQPISSGGKNSELYNNETIYSEISEKVEKEMIVAPDICKLNKRKISKPVKKRKSSGNYECPICGKNFVRASNLKAHMPLHTGIKNFPCTQCDKAYATLDHLKRHRKVHEDKNLQDNVKKKSHRKAAIPKKLQKIIKELKCGECNETFQHADDVQKHTLTSHKVQLEFQCTMCEKSFALESHLTIHLQLHSSEKSYKCDICGLIFRSTPSLESHKLNHVVTLPGYQFANQT